MISKLFAKEYNNTTYLQELLKENLDYQWLNEGLDDEMIDINYKDKNGDTFLMKCIKIAKINSIEWLLQHNADVTIKNKNNKTALLIAIEKKEKYIVQLLLDSNKIDINHRDLEGRTILQNIVVTGHNEMAKLLIKNGANIHNVDNKNRNLLYDALSYGDKTFIKYLLDLEKIELNYHDEDGNSLMHHIEVLRDDEIAKTLLESGADPTLQNQKGESYLLNTALREDHPEDVIDVALKHGADVNSKTSKDTTILMELIAISSQLSIEEKNRRANLLKMSHKMINNGGDINALEKNNETALFNAIRLCDYELVSFLLASGINPNIKNNDGETVLNLLIYEGVKELDILLLLIDYGINPIVKNNDGKTIFELLNDIILHVLGTRIIRDEKIAKKIKPDGQYIKLVKELLMQKPKNIDLDYLDSTGDPLFFKPLLYGDFPLFQLYIKYKLNINNPNQKNHTIFFEYILKVFRDNQTDETTCQQFQSNLSFIISHKIKRNYQDSLGWTILHKIMATECSSKLFSVLTKVVKFDYTIVDFQGRSVLHNAVLSNKPKIVKKIHTLEPEILNIADHYEMLPITYAALLGNQELVLLLLKLGSNLGAPNKIPAKALSKFSPMLKNMKKLKVDLHDLETIKRVDVLIEQIFRDFKII